VISSLLTSSGVKGRPRLGCCALQTDETRQSAAEDSRIPNVNVDMFHRPIRVHAPALYSVEVIELDRRILGDPGSSGGLRLSFFVRGSAHKRCRPAIPLPRKTET